MFMIGDRQMAFEKKVTIATEFKKITGLQPGGIVRVSGAKAGAITKIVPPATPGGKFRVADAVDRREEAVEGLGVEAHSVSRCPKGIADAAKRPRPRGFGVPPSGGT